jgi:phosphoglycerate dehydrogenase-like enzyme
MHKRVLVTGKSFTSAATRLLEESGCEVSHILEHLSEQALEAELQDTAAYILGGVERATAPVLKNAQGLEVIAFLGVGYGSYIDMPTATRMGIAVTNTPAANTQAVAEMTLGLMLAATRKIPFLNSRDRYRQGEQWEEASRNINKNTLGIIGMGNIGQRVARLAGCLGMRVVYWSRTRKEHVERELSVIAVTLEDLLNQADFVSLHCDYTEATRGLIGAKEIALMKESGILINTARAHLVDAEALQKSLAQGIIAAAAFDGYYVEPVPKPEDDPYGLLRLSEDRFILTPHIAWLTLDSLERMSHMAARDIIKLLNGQKSERVVNPDYKNWKSL